MLSFRISLLFGFMTLWVSLSVRAGEIIRHWKLDDGQGSQLADSSLLGNRPGEVTNPQWHISERGNCLEFDGTTWANMPRPGTVHQLNGWTLDCYFCQDEAEGMQYIISSEYFFLRLVHGMVNIGIANGGWQEVKGKNVEKGRWYRFSLAMDGQQADCYLDGELLGKIDTAGLAFDNSCEFKFGRNFFIEADYFRGKLSDVTVFAGKTALEGIAASSPVEQKRQELEERLSRRLARDLRCQLVETGCAPLEKQEYFSLGAGEDLAEIERKLEVAPSNAMFKVWQWDFTTRQQPPASGEELANWQEPSDESLLALGFPGGSETMSFLVGSETELRNLEVNLQIQGIASREIELRHLVNYDMKGGAWNNWSYAGRSVPVPFLLVKDPEILNHHFELEATPEQQKNGVIPIRDAEKLRALPLLPPRTLHSYSAVIHIPAEQAEGLYEGEAVFSAGGEVISRMKVKLRVFAGRLPSAHNRQDIRRPFVSSVYYWGEPGGSPDGKLTERQISRSRLAAEFRDMAAHGITAPIFVWDWPLIYDRTDEAVEALGLARDCGLDLSEIYFGMSGSTDAETDEDLSWLRQKVKSTLEKFRQAGLDGQVFWYGSDEATGDKLQRQLPAMEAIREAGGKVLVSCLPGVFEGYGSHLDIANQFGLSSPAAAEKYHAKGTRIWNYGSPFAGGENADLYRRNYGLALWLGNYDGVSDYCYCDPFVSEPWMTGNGFVLPTVNGVVPTVGWEAFREAQIDIRYASLLNDLAVQAGEDGREALDFLDSLPLHQGNLQLIRLQIIACILKLQEIIK